MINEERLLNEFIELVSVPCPSLDEKAEADLIVKKLAELGIKAEIDDAGKKAGGPAGRAGRQTVKAGIGADGKYAP